MTPEINATVILLIILSVLCATVLSLSGVRKLRPGILLARGIPRKGLLTNVNTRTLRAELKSSMRVERTPANRLYPAELSDRINVLQPQQTENQLAESLNKVHRIKAIHRKRKWRWRHRHKLMAIGISALLSVTTCVLRSTVTCSKVSPPDATSYNCTNEARYESCTLQSVQLRPAIDNGDCWFDRCYLTDAPCCSVKLLPADNWQANGTWAQAHWDIANSASNGQTVVQLKTHPTHLQRTTIRALQQLAPAAKARIHANRQAQQQSSEAHHNLPAQKKSVNRALSPITRVQILMHTAYNASFLLVQVLHCILRMLNMALCMLMPPLITSIWLFISMYATAVSIHTTLFENKQPSKCVPSPQVMQTCVILVSLLNIAANTTMFILTQVHCMLTVAAACSFLAQPHWITACLIMLYVPKAINKLTIRLAHVIQHAIQSLVKKTKQSKFPQPRIRNGAYWRRIRNKTRRLHKQPVYRYIKVLCWLHHFMQK